MSHDDKGFSEEKCLRCGWVMGHVPLNCNNDDTPHVFPSQLRPRSEWPLVPPVHPVPVDPAQLRLHDTTDAAVWTDEFMRIVIDGGIDIDWGLMVGWFANAIETGRDHGTRTQPEDEDRAHKPFTFSYHKPDGGYTDDPSESDGPLPLEEAVFQALGYASMCWSQTPNGIFDSTAAKSAGDALVAYIKDMT